MSTTTREAFWRACAAGAAACAGCCAMPDFAVEGSIGNVENAMTALISMGIVSWETIARSRDFQGTPYAHRR